jgi:hypothetical protein
MQHWAHGPTLGPCVYFLLPVTRQTTHPSCFCLHVGGSSPCGTRPCIDHLYTRSIQRACIERGHWRYTDLYTEFIQSLYSIQYRIYAARGLYSALSGAGGGRGEGMEGVRRLKLLRRYLDFTQCWQSPRARIMKDADKLCSPSPDASVFSI